MSYNKKAHLRDNIDAIKLALKLDKDKTQVTPGQREILARYSGFGGIKAILNPADKPEDISRWSKSEAELFPLVAELHEVLREASETPEEYKRYVNSLKSSILTAFYTPKPVIDAISESLKDSGITPTRFLDPSAGVGAFVSSFKEIAPQSEIYSFEKDLLTGKILSHLYPEDKIRIEGYEKMEGRYSQFYDVIASNIPFGDTAVFDPLLSNHSEQAVKQSTQAIHNYFFIKSAMSVREGGLIAFITSQGVLNSEQNKPIRELLMKSCDLVSAIRLPNNLFTEHAGTEVGSDLIILQRNNRNILPTKRQQDFIESRKLSNGISINNLFRDFNRVVQTSSKVDTDPYGKPAIVFNHDGGIEGIATELKRMLKEDFSQHLDVQHYQFHSQDNPAQAVAQSSHTVTKEIKQQPPKQELQQKGSNISPSDLNLFSDNPPGTEDLVEKEVTVNPQHTPVNPAIKPGHFAGTLFDMEDPAIKKEPTLKAKPEPISEQPLITLYDLFGFTQEERSQVSKPKKRSRKTKSHASKPKELPFMDWREEMAYNTAQERQQQSTQTNSNKQVYPVFDARQEEHQEQLRAIAEQERLERLKPIPYYKAENLPEHYREGSLVTDENNRIGYLRDLEGFQPMFHPLELTDTQKMKASLYIEIRDTYHHLYSNEATRLEANPALREMLNRLYDDFTRRFGNINDAKNLNLIKMDAGGTEILSLERYVNGQATKADIFQQPVAFNPNEISHADTSKEALVASLNKFAKVNLEYMATLTDRERKKCCRNSKGMCISIR